MQLGTLHRQIRLTACAQLRCLGCRFTMQIKMIAALVGADVKINRCCSNLQTKVLKHIQCNAA